MGQHFEHYQNLANGPRIPNFYLMLVQKTDRGFNRILGLSWTFV